MSVGEVGEMRKKCRGIGGNKKRRIRRSEGK